MPTASLFNNLPTTKVIFLIETLKPKNHFLQSHFCGSTKNVLKFKIKKLSLRVNINQREVKQGLKC